MVKAVVGNWWNGKKIIIFLLNWKRGNILIIKGVVKVVIGNGESGKEIIAFLLSWRGGDTPIINRVVV